MVTVNICLVFRSLTHIIWFIVVPVHMKILITYTICMLLTFTGSSSIMWKDSRDLVTVSDHVISPMTSMFTRHSCLCKNNLGSILKLFDFIMQFTYCWSTSCHYNCCGYHLMMYIKRVVLIWLQVVCLKSFVGCEHSILRRWQQFCDSWQQTRQVLVLGCEQVSGEWSPASV